MFSRIPEDLGYPRLNNIILEYTLKTHFIFATNKCNTIYLRPNLYTEFCTPK